MIRTCQYRLRPNQTQIKRLREALEEDRSLYNAALQARIDCHRKTGRSLTAWDQMKSLTEIRSEDPEFRKGHVARQRGPSCGWTGLSRLSSVASKRERSPASPGSRGGTGGIR